MKNVERRQCYSAAVAVAKTQLNAIIIGHHIPNYYSNVRTVLLHKTPGSRDPWDFGVPSLVCALLLWLLG